MIQLQLQALGAPTKEEITNGNYESTPKKKASDGKEKR
jgi:hypothetical protein